MLWREQYAGGGGWQSLYGNLWWAQTFTPSIPHRITRASIRVCRYGSTPGTVTVSIRATDTSGHPTGADLTSGTFDGNAIPAGAINAIWKDIDLTPYDLSAKTKYALIVRAPSGNSSNYIFWEIDISGAYGGGNVETSVDGGSSWHASPSDDMSFKEGGPRIYKGNLNIDQLIYQHVERMER